MHVLDRPVIHEHENDNSVEYEHVSIITVGRVA